MLVLHGFWSGPRGLCVWAEDSGLAVKSPSQALRSARPHPFAASASTLTAIHAETPDEAALLLPWHADTRSSCCNTLAQS